MAFFAVTQDPKQNKTMSKLESIEALLVQEIRDLYGAGTQLVKALPKMAKAATAPDLRAGFEAHHRETKIRVDRLEEVANSGEFQ